MKAIVCEEFAGVEKLQYKEVPDPIAKKGQVVIDVKASGVNFPDGLLVQGLYQMKPELPFVPGSEVAGVVSEIGEGVPHLKVGQRVIGITQLGGYAEKVACNAMHTMPIPDPIPDDEAAALVTAHATAHHALKQRAKIQPVKHLLLLVPPEVQA